MKTGKLVKFLSLFLLTLTSISLVGCKMFPRGSEDDNENGQGGEEEPPVRTRTDDYNDVTISYREYLPRIDINSLDNSMSFATDPGMDQVKNGISYTACNISVSNCEDEFTLTDESAGVKVRGNATANYPKKPFRIKFDKKRNMLGLNQGAKAKSWVLLADYKDGSMLRNAVSLFLGRKLLESDGYYCADFAPVTLYINYQYWGVYLLTEQQQINKHRFNITEAPENYTGTDIGYLIEYDGYATREPASEIFQISYHNNGSFKNIYGNNVTNSSRQGRYFTIKSDFYSSTQRDYIRQYTETAYNIVYEAVVNNNYCSFTNNYQSYAYDSSLTSVEETVSRVIDVPSLVSTYILNEIACDLDVDWSSFYMSVDHGAEGNHKLTFQGPWDFDSSYALRDINSDGTGLRAANSPVNAWLVILQQQAWFQKLIKEKWIELRKYNVFKDTLNLINTYHELYNASYMANYSKWPGCLGGIGGEQRYPLNSYTTHTQWTDNLYSWCHTRFNYLNGLWGDKVDVLTDYVEPEPPVEDPTGAVITYRYEAEDGVLIDCSRINTSSASNGYCIGELFGYIGRGFVATIYSDRVINAKIRFCIVRRTYDHTLDEWFTLEINGINIQVPSILIPGIGGNYNAYNNWYNVDVVNFNLKEGSNIIKILTKNEHAANFDYIEILTTATLTR